MTDAEVLARGAVVDATHEVITAGWSGDPQAVRRAVRAARAAVAAAAPETADPAELYDHLFISMHIASMETRDLDVARQTVAVARQALAVAPPDYRRRDRLWRNLSDGLGGLAELVEDPEVPREAVEAARGAVAAADSAESQSTLARHLTVLFDRERDFEVLLQAVQAARRCVARIRPGRKKRRAPLGQLCSLLQTLFEWTGQTRVLEEIVELRREATTVSEDKPKLRALHLSELQKALRNLYDHTGDLSTLREAIKVCRKILENAPPGSELRAFAFSSLAALLRERCERTGQVKFLRRAVTAARDALGSAAPQHRDMFVVALADVLRKLWERSGEPAALREAEKTADEALGLGDTTLRVTAAELLARMSLSSGAHEHAFATVERAVSWVPGLASPGAEMKARRIRLTAAAALASTAAAAAITTGRPRRAVELIEQIRGVLLAESLNLREDVTDLREQYPRLAAEYDDLLCALEQAPPEEPEMEMAPSRFDIDAYQKSWEQWNRLVATREAATRRQWDHLLSRIRAQPGFADFHLPLTLARLRRAAAEGPIVYLTVRGEHGHALVVRDAPQQPVDVVDLPGLSEAAAHEQAALLKEAVALAQDHEALAADRVEAQHRLLAVLGWLWDAIAAPVLGHLGHTAEPEGENWPRLWWCPVGILSMLPVHAAGHHHAEGTSAAVMDRVVSSYTPTIRALIPPRERRTAPPRPGSTVVVAVPDAPWVQPLPGADAEADTLRQLIPSATVLPAPGSRTGHDSVTAALPRHEIAHFACHGVVDWDEPDESHLVLHDHATKPLTVATIARMHLPHARLAYLAACSTHDTSLTHADQATHLNAAFHMAGYRGVVGTLWPINDKHANPVTRAFYRRLTQNGTTAPDPGNAAVALHHTVREHRDHYRQLPTRWAAYIHTGR